jgi:glucosyl-3-phosphoglycerate synthase
VDDHQRRDRRPLPRQPLTAQITYAVIGHNEAATLEPALSQPLRAARPGDRVWFVDSASTDGSAAVADRLGVEVIEAPLGKGRAVAVAAERCPTRWLCTLDADLLESEINLAAGLSDAVGRGGAEMVVGDLSYSRRSSVTLALHGPLVGALFPEAVQPDLRHPLTGYRAWDVALEVGPLPPEYGVETHLNVAVPVAGGRVRVVDLGHYRGPLRGYANVPQVARDVASAVLDLAERHGRLAAGARPVWEAWVGEVLAVIDAQPPVEADATDYLERLRRVAARPLPSPEG